MDGATPASEVGMRGMLTAGAGVVKIFSWRDGAGVDGSRNARGIAFFDVCWIGRLEMKYLI